MRDGSLSTPKSIGLTGFLNDVLRDSRPPLIKLFRTDKSAYLYDTGTNRIMECSELEVDLITNILTLGIKEGIAKCKQTHPHDNCLGALRALGAHIEKENILKTRPAVQFGLSAHFGDFEDLVANSLRMIILEVTERCNLKIAGCHSFITRLKEGYETNAGEIGSRLSGGEKQRISIARCLLKDPDLIIFDEPTSNIDPILAKSIMSSINDILKLRTCIMIGHDMLSLSLADRIISIEDGYIVYDGLPTGVLTKEGAYNGLAEHLC